MGWFDRLKKEAEDAAKSVSDAVKQAEAKAVKARNDAAKSISDAKNKVGTELGKAIDAAKTTLSKAGQDIRFAPLLFFKPLMKSELNRRQIPHNDDISDISTLFLNKVVRVMPGRHFDTEYHLIDDAIAIVKEVIDFIKGLQSKKDSGVPLTPDETSVLDHANDTAETIVPVVVDNSVKNGGKQKITVSDDGSVKKLSGGLGSVLKKDTSEMAGMEKFKNFMFSWKGALSIVSLAGLIFGIYHLTKK